MKRVGIEDFKHQNTNQNGGNVIANKRHALRWHAVRDSVNIGRENSYVPTLHIT